MSNRIDDHTAALQAWAVKAINYIAASLGIGTFLGLVNVVVGVLSACWLGLQLYGYLKYELPIKRYRREHALRELERMRTAPSALEADE